MATFRLLLAEEDRSQVFAWAVFQEQMGIQVEQLALCKAARYLPHMKVI